MISRFLSRLKVNGVAISILAIALIVRLITTYDWFESPYMQIPLIDALDHHQQALKISEGQLLSPGAFYGSPFYPYLLAGTYLFTNGSPHLMILIQILLGVGTCIILARSTESYFGKQAGLCAGLIAALYAPFIFFTPTLMKETVAIFCIALFVSFVAKAHLFNKLKYFLH
ncbi:MAG: glycosyltransferase family 39 protein [Pseudomonadota bacterium]|nr:glycosyltransferase family 39 protein [Pseudomonadota bacterium]